MVRNIVCSVPKGQCYYGENFNGQMLDYILSKFTDYSMNIYRCSYWDYGSLRSEIGPSNALLQRNV